MQVPASKEQTSTPRPWETPCPECHVTPVPFGVTSVGSGIALVNVRCPVCAKEWTVTYEMRS